MKNGFWSGAILVMIISTVAAVDSPRVSLALIFSCENMTVKIIYISPKSWLSSSIKKKRIVKKKKKSWKYIFTKLNYDDNLRNSQGSGTDNKVGIWW